jgi:hypothetical protein
VTPIHAGDDYQAGVDELRAVFESIMATRGRRARWYKRVGELPVTSGDIADAYGDSDPVEDNWVAWVLDPSLFQEQPSGVVLVADMPRELAPTVAAALLGGSSVKYCSTSFQLRAGDVVEDDPGDGEGPRLFRVTRVSLERDLYFELTLEVAR